MQKSGHFDKVNDKILKKIASIETSKLTIPKLGLINKNFRGTKIFLQRADFAIDGKIYAFSHEYFDYQDKGIIAWNMNPVTKVKADTTLNWNRLPDFGEYGDIKLIWEASRFPQVYSFINAYAATKDEKYAKACLKQMVAWIDANPYPKGVNYKCGQEITFRLIAWMVGIDYFRDFLSYEDEAKIVRNIYASVLRIDANIDYAARAVKNNHSLSEATGLILFGLYFKQFDESKRLLKKGVKYLQKESAYQIYRDGSYIQHSFTYQRLALDVLSFVIMLAQKKEFSLPTEVQDRHKKMIHFLNSFMQKDGWLPNYGSNDGANLFPVSDSDYRDFRPSLNFASVLAKGSIIYKGNSALSELFGFDTTKQQSLEKIQQFDVGGYYILENDNTFVFTRCHSYRDRPAQNDMLHADIWHRGKNIFCDAGSFSYNTDKKFKNNFNGTIGHNTIMIDDENQMEQVLNFGWANWTKSKMLKFNDNVFQGEHYGYQKKYGTLCNRTIILKDNEMKTVDKISSIQRNINIKQIWNTQEKIEVIDAYTVKVDTCIVKSNYPINIEASYISDYYNSYKTGAKLVIETNSDKDVEIETIMEFLK